MYLNPKSWFYRNYLLLGDPDWDSSAPNTICELATRFLRVTFWYVLIAYITVVSVYMGLNFGLFPKVDAFPAEWSAYSSFVLGLTTLVGQGLSLFALALLIVLPIVYLIVTIQGKIVDTWREMKRKRRHAAAMELETAEKTEPNFVVSFARGLYTRVKDKTCVIINYTKDDTNEA